MVKKTDSCTTCTAIMWIVGLLLFLTTLAALVGVWKAHFPDTGAVFGSTSGSLSLLALGVNAALWLKVMRKCCPCKTDQKM